MRELNAELYVEIDGELSESPRWDHRSGRLLWVDILAGRVFTGPPAGLLYDNRGEPVGAVALRASGGYVAVAAGRLVFFDERGQPLGERAMPGTGGEMRCNDARVDASGRLWVDVMGRGAQPGIGSLIRLGPDGAVVTEVEGATIPNGMGWSASGGLFYWVDGPARRINLFDVDSGGSLSGRRTFVSLDDTDGVPDGLIVDADDAVWVALYNGSQVRRYLPDGTLDVVVHVPVPRVTSMCFAGPELDQLVITTAREGAGEDELARHPLLGSLFRCRPGIRGANEALFAG